LATSRRHTRAVLRSRERARKKEEKEEKEGKLPRHPLAHHLEVQII